MEDSKQRDTLANVITFAIVVSMVIGLYVFIDNKIATPAAEWVIETGDNLQQYMKDQKSKCQSTVKKSAFREGFCESLMER